MRPVTMLVVGATLKFIGAALIAGFTVFTAGDPGWRVWVGVLVMAVGLLLILSARRQTRRSL